MYIVKVGILNLGFYVISNVMMLNFLVGAGKEMGRRAYDGLLLDAANTLLQLTKPVEETYAVIGKKYGLLVPSFNSNISLSK